MADAEHPEPASEPAAITPQGTGPEPTAVETSSAAAVTEKPAETPAPEPAPAPAPAPAAAPGGPTQDAFVQNQFLTDVSHALSPGLQEHLCGCCTDLGGCVVTCFLPCVVAGTTRALLDERECTPCDALCCPSPYFNRQSMRAKYHLGIDVVTDTLSFLFCTCCFINQDARELGVRRGAPPLYFPQTTTVPTTAAPVTTQPTSAA